MAVRKITEYPENVLAQIGKPITEFDQELADLCADMFDTMYDAEGVGLVGVREPPPPVLPPPPPVFPPPPPAGGASCV